jgi:hypothetical protein
VPLDEGDRQPAPSKVDGERDSDWSAADDDHLKALTHR